MVVMELDMLVEGSVLPGDNCEGLCGVWGWNDMMLDRRQIETRKISAGARMQDCRKAGGDLNRRVAVELAGRN